MDDMALDVPPPPAPAEESSQVGQEAGGENQMPGDTNSLDAGQNGKPNTGNQKLDGVISQIKQSDDPDGKLEQLADYGEKGLGLNTAPAQDANAQMPMESRFDFRRIIDEVFGEIEKTTNFTKGTTTREPQFIEDGAVTEYQSPFTPRLN